MKSKFLVPFFAFSLLLFPVSADAALVPCGGTGQDPCTLCHLVVGIDILIDYIRTIMVFIALAAIVGMAIWYIVSAGDPGMMGTAKKGIWAALGGIVIILLAWLIVNIIMFLVFDAKDDLGISASFSILNGFTFDCDATLE